MTKQKVRSKLHYSKYSYKQFVVPAKVGTEIIYEGSTENIPDNILELANLDIDYIIVNKVKFINIWR